MANRTATRRAPQAAGRSRRPVADPLDRRLEAAQRTTVVVVTVLVGLLVWRPLADPFMLPKVTAVVLGAVVLLSLAGVRAVRQAGITVPVGRPVWVAAALGLALVVATLTADNPLLALVGHQRRYSGLMSYAAYLVVFFACLRVLTTDPVRRLAQAVVVTSGLVTAYGFVQVAGLDPYVWNARLDEEIFSTMGNTNFAAAYVAMTLPVAAALALSPRWSPAWRVAAGALLPLGGAYVVATEAAQGPIAAVAGLAVVAVGWLQARRRIAAPAQRAGRSAGRWLLVGAAAGVVVVLGLAVRLAPDVLDSSLGERLQFWQAALGIFGDHPVLGAGLDSFRDYFPRYRPVEHAVERGYQAADSSHNLPLGMLANGGLLLGLTYLAFVGYTGWTLVRGLVTVGADRLPLLAGFGGMWAAYQVQSLVSIDVPALAFHHFLSAAVVFALVRPPAAATARLPLTTAARGQLLPGSPAGRRRATAGVLAAVVLVGLTSAWVGTRPLRADFAAEQGRRGGQGLPAFERAVSLAPWEAEYHLLHAQALADAGRGEEAYDAAVRASDLRLGSSKLPLGNADLALRSDQPETAREWVEVALRRDPQNPVAHEDAAEILTKAGDADAAERLLQRAAELKRQGAEP